MKFTLIALLLLSSFPANANEYQPGYSTSQTCFKKKYREEYVPGTYSNPGYVKSWKDTIEVPCQSRGISTSRNHYHQPQSVYPVASSNNFTAKKSSCNTGATTTGGLLGGGLAAVLSKKDAYGWSIPLGAVLGMGVANADC